METGRFKTISISIKALILGLYVVGGAYSPRHRLPRNLIAFNWLKESSMLESNPKDYWNLSMQFVTQKNQAYCGVASIVMVLNALSIPAPEYSPTMCLPRITSLTTNKPKVLLR